MYKNLPKPEMIAIYRKNFANLFSASKIRRQSAMDKDDSDDDSKSGSSSDDDEDEEPNPNPTKKVKSNMESCQNLAGLETNSLNQSAIKDPFSLLKDKNEAKMGFIPEQEDKESDQSEENEPSKTVTEEDKAPAEIIKTEPIKKGSTEIPKANGDQPSNIKINQTNTNSNTTTPNTNINTNTNTQNIPNVANIPQSSFLPNANNPNANLLSFLDTLNRGSAMPAPNPNMMNPFSNPALLAMLANSQNPLSMMNSQKGLAGLLNAQPTAQNQSSQERELLMKALQKNNAAAAGNMPNFGMNFNNYAMLNSLLMNPGMAGAGQFNLFDNLFGGGMTAPGGLNIPSETTKPSTNQQQPAANTRGNANAGAGNQNWNTNQAQNNNKQANEAFIQRGLNNLLGNSGQSAFQGAGGGDRNGAANQNQAADNNYLKNLLIQALKNGNANPSQLMSIASLLNKDNGGVKKEEEK